MVEPITPDKALEQFDDEIPDKVFTAVNDLIVKHLQPGPPLRATFTITEVRDQFREVGLDLIEVGERNWYDFEPAYRKVGWKVVYDQPGFNEPGEGTYAFVFATMGRDNA